MEIIESNKLISEFMGYTYYPTPSDFFPNGRLFGTGRTYDLHSLKYNELWDWLIPVIIKIESMKGIRVIISGTGIEIFCFGYSICKSTSESKIESVYKGCIEFINWYNDQK